MDLVTLIITIWKRNYLQEQIKYISCQSLKPKEVWIIQQEDHIDVTQTIEKFRADLNIHHIRIPKNLKFFPRFSFANLVSTEYVWILDDDILPGKNWMEYALLKSKEYNSIIACTGRILVRETQDLNNRYLESGCIGDNTIKAHVYVEEDTLVDFGIQSYFLKKIWLEYFWGIKPFTLENGDDIHLGASVKIGGGIKTIIPKQTDPDYCGNHKLSYGQDQHASWMLNNFFNVREEYFKYLINQKKWRPINFKYDFYFEEFSYQNLHFFNAADHPHSYSFSLTEQNSLLINCKKKDVEYFCIFPKQSIASEELRLSIDMTQQEKRHIMVLARGTVGYNLMVSCASKDEYSSYDVFLQVEGIVQEISNEYQWIHFDFSSIPSDDESTMRLLSRVRGFQFCINPGTSASGELELLALFAGSLTEFQRVLN